MKKLVLGLVLSILLITPVFASEVKTFEAKTKEELDSQVNAFIKSKNVKQISYTMGQSSSLAGELLFGAQNLKEVYSCMVLYDEKVDMRIAPDNKELMKQLDEINRQLENYIEMEE